MKISKAVIILNLVLIVICGTLVSCKNTDDPFDSFTGNEHAGSDELEDFYSLTMPESYGKYGTFCISSWGDPLFKTFDGKYLYIDVTTDIETGNGKKQITTIGRTEYPDGGYAKPICTDPLCTHAEDSSCPFAHLTSAMAVVCYKGNIYFSVKGTKIINDKKVEFYDVYVYRYETNKSETILTELSDCYYYRCDGNFYIDASFEDEDFNVTHVIYRVTEDARTVKVCEYQGAAIRGNVIYKERYIISQAFDEITRDDGSVSYIQRPEAIMTDMTTGRMTTVFSRPVPELDEYDIRDITVTPVMIYGDLLVIKADFNGRSEGKPEFYRSEAWLIDLASGEKRLLTYSEGEKDFDYICLCSEKMILIKEPEEENNGHFVARLIDPYNKKETVYDLTAAARAAGEELPENCFMTEVVKGAIRVQRYWKEGKKINLYEIKTEDVLLYDIESGRTYCYPINE